MDDKPLNLNKFSKIIVAISILSILVYTSIVLYFSWYDKFIPDSLTYSFYGVFGIELSALAGIRIKEIRYHDSTHPIHYPEGDPPHYGKSKEEK